MAWERHDRELERALQSKPPHMAVWIDHKTARIFWLYRDHVAEYAVRRPDPGANGHLHHHSGTPGAGHRPLPTDFLENVVQAIGGAEEILILGPVEARHALKNFLNAHKPRLAAHVLGQDSVEDPSPSRITNHARRFFARVHAEAAE